MRDRLLELSRRASDEDKLTKQIGEALAKTDDERLDRYLKETFGQGVTDRMRYLDADDREDAIRARVETLARPEMLQFEQMILIETFDQVWKDHLYAMDQLRDTIGFRAIAQTDPKIEFKREGQRYFLGAMREIRERVTDFVFKARLAPPRPMPGGPGGPGAPMRPAPVPQGAPAAPTPPRPAPQGGGGNIFGSTISGPGFNFGPPARPAAPPQQPPASPPAGES